MPIFIFLSIGQTLTVIALCYSYFVRIIAYCLLLIAYCLLLIAYCLLLIALVRFISFYLADFSRLVTKSVIVLKLINVFTEWVEQLAHTLSEVQGITGDGQAHTTFFGRRLVSVIAI